MKEKKLKNPFNIELLYSTPGGQYIPHKSGIDMPSNFFLNHLQAIKGHNDNQHREV
jgi:hypothetical protein